MEKKPKPLSAWAQVYNEIASNDTRRLNWRAMNYFVHREAWAEAAVCRDRVKSWNKGGPA